MRDLGVVIRPCTRVRVWVRVLLRVSVLVIVWLCVTVVCAVYLGVVCCVPCVWCVCVWRVGAWGVWEQRGVCVCARNVRRWRWGVWIALWCNAAWAVALCVVRCGAMLRGWVRCGV